MNQILLYGGFSVAILMFSLCVTIWFRLHIRKTWKDVSSCRVQKLGTNPRIKSKYYRTMPLPAVPVKTETGGSEETTLLHSDIAEWKVLDEVVFIHTSGI